jgi:predicted CoA-binding protein
VRTTTNATISPHEVIRNSKVIAVVGASKNEEKDAHSVPQYLKDHGYAIVPINPTAAEIFGEKSFPDLLSLPDDIASKVDVVEVFRPSEELPEIARQVVALSKRSGKKYVFWAQAGLQNDEAKKILDDSGIPYVMNACMRVVHGTSLNAK